LRPLGLGDLLTGIPALRALAAAFPHHRKILAAPPLLEPLARLIGAIDDFIATAPLAPLAPVLYGADVAVDLHGRGPESHRVLLAASPRRLIAFENTAIARSLGQPPWIAEEHEVDRWCRLLMGNGISADPHDLYLPTPPLNTYAMGATLLHQGAKSAARRWPVERWIGVARAEQERGRRVIVTGDAHEYDRCMAIARGAGIPPEDLFAGRTDLAQLAGIVASAARVVSGDTGVAHLATAFRVPSVLLFGPTDPAHWGPRIDRHLHRVIWYGQRGDPHGEEIDPSLDRITVHDVLEQLAMLP